MSFVRVLRRFLLRSHCNVNQCKSLGTGIDAQHVGDRHGIEVTRPDTSDFLPPNKAFAVKSNWELFRGWLVFKMFTYNSLVDNSKAVRDCKTSNFYLRDKNNTIVILILQ